ncbi:MAG: hypothetical protein ACOCV4_02625 [Myxococcota bacterium]
MDPKRHARFLEYLELSAYFTRGEMQRLGVDEFVVMDAELEALEAREQAGEIGAEERMRIRALRRLLLRD